VLNIREATSESQGADEYDFYRTQFEILKSRALAARVIQEQGLEMHDFSTGEATKAGGVAHLWAQVTEWVTQQEWVQQFFPPPQEAKGENEEVREESPPRVDRALIYTYKGMLQIIPVLRTRLVKIVFSTPAPALSARLANAHAHAYIQQGLGLRTQANEEAQHFLQGRLTELKELIEQSEATLNNFRRAKKISSLDDRRNTALVERLSDLNRRLSEAEAEKLGLEAQLHVIRKQNYDAIPAISASPLVQMFKQQLAQREEEAAQLSTLLKPGHPRLDRIKAQEEETRRQLRQEINKVVRGIESAHLATVERVRALRNKIEEQKAESLALKDAAVQYDILSREVDTNRQLYDSVLQRMKEMGVAAELRVSNVSMIDDAQPPGAPANASQKKKFFIGAFIGLMGGVVLAFFLEYVDTTLKTPEEVARYLGLPYLGIVPNFSGLNGRRYAPWKLLYTLPRRLRSSVASNQLALVSSHHPRAVVTDAYRTLRTAILLSRAGEPPRTILFTSGIQGEGKTVTVINTAFVFAQTGVRVLVIDADLRRPACHRVLGIDNGFGLTEVLTGRRAPEEVIHPTMIKHLFLLNAGSSPPDTAELLGSKKMQEILASLQEHYDYILIDSPSLKPLSDTMLLSSMVDGVVLVVNSQGTSKYVVKEARARLSYARAKILGVILNRVDLPSGDSALYDGNSDSYSATHEKDTTYEKGGSKSPFYRALARFPMEEFWLRAKSDGNEKHKGAGKES
jgi:capsular exopolysaccharide synthesis family protein